MDKELTGELVQMGDHLAVFLQMADSNAGWF